MMGVPLPETDGFLLLKEVTRCGAMDDGQRLFIDAVVFDPENNPATVRISYPWEQGANVQTAASQAMANGVRDRQAASGGLPGQPAPTAVSMITGFRFATALADGQVAVLLDLETGAKVPVSIPLELAEQLGAKLQEQTRKYRR